MRVEFSRIAGDVYVNGKKIIFAVDFTLGTGVPEFSQVDWLIGWAKVGLMSHGHTVPHFESKSTTEFEKLASLPRASDTTGETGEKKMKSESLEATEAECAAGRTAPRVKLDDIKAAIKAEYYFTAGAAIAALGLPATVPTSPLDLLTICILQMGNGFTIIGKAAPASPENFDAELGKKLAYEDAVRQIWPLMGFSLRDRLAAEADEAQDVTQNDD